MKHNRRELKPGMKGAEVKTLLNQLTTLGYTLPQTELSQGRFGRGTRQAVQDFQQQHGLAPSGVVDEKTAGLLRDAAEARQRGHGPAPKGEAFLVRGHVRQSDGDGQIPLTGAVVKAFDWDIGGENLLGKTQTDAEGAYKIHYTADQFRRSPAEVGGPDLIARVYNEQGQLLAAAPRRNNAGPVETVDLTVTVEAVNQRTFQVTGRVASRVSAGVGGLRVRIVDKRVGEDIQLAEAVTAEDGTYQAAFIDADLRKPCGAQPDLQARVFAGETFLGVSAVRYNASTRETLNVLLDEKAASALRSEYETLTGALACHFTGQLGDLKETDERRDITYLANKTGWDARAVALATLAAQFSAGAKIDAALFYALFRAGLPANEAALYQASAKTVEVVWKQAIAQGVIPASLEKSLPAALEQFQKLAAQKSLDNPALLGVSSLKEMLSVSLGDDPDRQKQFADLYTRYRDDMPAFWKAVGDAFGEAMRQRLQLDGQLAYLTLNNGPLIRSLYAAVGQKELTNTLDLVEAGYHRAEQWQQVIGDAPVPPEVPGKDEAERRARYAKLLAAQVRLSFPTATVAQMVRSGETPMPGGLAEPVHNFLMQHQGKFEIGMQPVAQYVAQNKLSVAPEVTKAITRIHRIYQITPGDEAMNALLKRGLDSAYAVTHYDRDTFVASFKDELGGEAAARQVHARAQQVHNAALNIAVSYLTASRAPGVGVHSPAQIVDPTPTGPNPHASDVIAYPTLENLLGELDYCECEHCRSILSPAAYLVDLLKFIDLRRYNEAGNEILPRTYVGENPLDVLLSRRPDIQHLPLTCENTNTPLPYIDLVNETLEHYVINNLSLAGYTGHTTDGSATPEELLANPQFVSDIAYETLAGKAMSEGDPPPLLPPAPPLPFHQPLENLRRYFDKFEAPLPDVMEALRTNDDLERPAPDDPAHPVEYGWRDILMEELRLSRAEHALLTDGSLTLQQLYGFPPATPEADVLAKLSNAKAFTRRVSVSYEDLVEILKTRFVNPSSTLIPRLEQLGVPFATLKALKDGSITDEAFDEAIAPHLDESQYGGDIKAWVKNQVNYDNFMSLITLADPTGANNICSFDQLEFRYADPDTIALNIRAFEFVRLIRFIRLWKKLGWTVEQTDKTITALYPADQTPNDADDSVNLQRLDAGFRTLLPRLGILRRVMESLNLTLQKDLLSLLACFAPIDMHGTACLYRQMFPAALRKQVPAFDDDGYGGFLTGTAEKLIAHTETLRAGFSLTADELSQIVATRGYDSDTPLNIDTITEIFRRGWLARKLKLSVREFLLLTRFTGIDPFAAPDPVHPPILHFIALANRLRALALKPAQALYLIWNQDLSGKSAPGDAEISGFARVLRTTLAAIESEFALADDPDGQIARARMALVYGNESTDFFFGLLDNTLVTDVPYTRGPVDLTTVVPYAHSQPTLEPAILEAASGVGYDDSLQQLSFAGALTIAARDALKAVAGVTAEFKTAVDNLYAENQKVIQFNLEQPIVNEAPGRVAYDDFRKRLVYSGVLTETVSDALKAAAARTLSPPSAVDEFNQAVDDLYEKNQAAIGPFFARYPELELLHTAYAVSADPVEKKRSDLLANFLPELKRRRKQQQALQTISAALKIDVGAASLLLNDAAVLHAAGDNTLPALNDLLALETPGLAAQFFFRDTAAGAVDDTRDAESNLAYAARSSNTLPAPPVSGTAISGIWSGHLEAPENGFYNIRIETETDTTVTLALDGVLVALARDGNMWSNSVPIELRAGAFYPIVLTVEKVRDNLIVRWETAERRWEVIPARYLYTSTRLDHLRQTYIRFLKAASPATALKLTAAEMAYLASHPDYAIGGSGWLNSLVVTGDPDDTTTADILRAFTGLLDFARLKAALSPNDERLLAVLKDPAAVTQNADSLLLALTRWEPGSLDSLLVRFGKVDGSGRADRNALRELNTFGRVYDAYTWVKLLGVPAVALIQAAANEPDAVSVRGLQAALRARYSESDWLNVIKSINDEMRARQRDALMAYILHQMRENPANAHIDTPEKLFEYFLMDVQMEPCMQTSRIRHALSSVQLFIERCLMNLEQRVAPASINARHWAWMNRYRVWEANRKVFLYPENWLEPELRDDQSPFFKETMSELLQSDITEDTAAVALLNYLSKLEQVAKLEPCGIHWVENDPSKAEDDIAHVVARTAGANRKYYYRRREYGYWTPWEQIKLDIEDNPVIPAVWKGRLFLFWLRILKQAPLEVQKPGTGDVALTSLKTSDIKTDPPNVTVQAVLCWSEYYNGKWQPTKTSDINKPLDLGQYELQRFVRSTLGFSVSEMNQGSTLQVYVYGKSVPSLVLYNTHSLPVRQITDWSNWSDVFIYDRPVRSLSATGSDTFMISYYLRRKSSDRPDFIVQRRILKDLIGDRTGRTIASQHALQDIWTAPFFYENSHHVFYITSAERPVQIPEWNGFISVVDLPTITEPGLPPLVFKPFGFMPELADMVTYQPGFGVPAPSPIEQYVTEDAYIQQAIGTPGTVRFGDKEIGPAGSQITTTWTS